MNTTQLKTARVQALKDISEEHNILPAKINYNQILNQIKNERSFNNLLTPSFFNSDNGIQGKKLYHIS